jgi:hypothetical protein
MDDMYSVKPSLSKAQLDYWKTKIQDSLKPLKSPGSLKALDLSKKTQGLLASYRKTLEEISPKRLTSALDRLRRQQPSIRQSLRSLIKDAKALSPSQELTNLDRWFIKRRDQLSESVSPFVHRALTTPEKWWRKVKSYSSKAPRLKASDIKDSIKQAVAESNAHVKNYFTSNRAWFAQWKPKLRSGGFLARLKQKLLSLRDFFALSNSPVTYVTSLVALVKRAIKAVLDAGSALLARVSTKKESKLSWLKTLVDLRLGQRLGAYVKRFGMKLVLVCGFLFFMYGLGTTLPHLMLRWLKE